MKNEEFYIGYLPQAPEKTSKFIRNILIVAFILIVSAGILLAIYQKKFSTAVFEYGSHKEYTGVYTNNPIPSIRIINQKDSTGKIINMTIPLVGYGKHGAESAIENYEVQNSISLNGKKITLRGSLIYGEGKTLLSLNNEGAIACVSETKDKTEEMMVIGDTILNGEIIDPKCYFGVMKPGRGKVHRECAIRCISGGIPPVFRAHASGKRYEYFLLLGKNGVHINQNVLPFVADLIELKGTCFQWGDWKVFESDINAASRLN